MRATLIACGVWALAVVAGAQVVNPTTVEFTASADHHLAIDGEPVVQRYELWLYYVGAAEPFATYDLGKPTPDAAMVITTTNAAWFTAATAGLRCVARVTAIGALGNGVSDPSNEWMNEAATTGPPAKGLVWIVITQ